MKKISLLLGFCITGLLAAQVAVPEVTKALYNKKTASWCGPCGDWGAEANTDIENGIGDKAVLFKLTASTSGTLYNAVCGELYAGYNTMGGESWPNFYVNGVNLTEFATGGGIYTGTTINNCTSEVDNFYSENSADVNAGFSYNVTSDSILVDVTTKFFNAMSGNYFTAVYVLEDDIAYNQAGAGNISSDHIMRASLAGTNAFGAPVGTGSVDAGTVVNASYGIALNSSWKPGDLHVITVVWKDNGDGTYSSVNANDGASAPVGIDEISETNISVYPNPVADIVNISLKEAQNANVVIYNVLGESVLNTRSTDSDNIAIDMSELNSGIYWIEVNNQTVKKVVKH
jgi:hypothetical protein